MAKNESESLFVNPFSEEPSSPSSEDPPKSDKFQEEIISAANEATIMAGRGLPTEDESVEQAFLDLTNSYAVDAQTWAGDRQSGASPKNDLIISFRAAFQGLVVSLIDSAPSEICVISLSNVNALATWNMLRTATSTAYITITSLQIDNMVPNAPFAVAVSGEQNGTGDSDQSQSDAPLLVVGISFAPRHKSGIVVRIRFTEKFATARRNLTQSLLFSVPAVCDYCSSKLGHPYRPGFPDSFAEICLGATIPLPQAGSTRGDGSVDDSKYSTQSRRLGVCCNIRCRPTEVLSRGSDGFALQYQALSCSCPCFDSRASRFGG